MMCDGKTRKGDFYTYVPGLVQGRTKHKHEVLVYAEWVVDAIMIVLEEIDKLLKAKQQLDTEYEAPPPPQRFLPPPKSEPPKSDSESSSSEEEMPECRPIKKRKREERLRKVKKHLVVVCDEKIVVYHLRKNGTVDREMGNLDLQLGGSCYEEGREREVPYIKFQSAQHLYGAPITKLTWENGYSNDYGAVAGRALVTIAHNGAIPAEGSRVMAALVV